MLRLLAGFFVHVTKETNVIFKLLIFLLNMEINIPTSPVLCGVYFTIYSIYTRFMYARVCTKFLDFLNRHCYLCNRLKEITLFVSVKNLLRSRAMSAIHEKDGKMKMK